MLAWHFVARSEKPEKPLRSPSPSRPVGAVCDLEMTMTVRRDRSAPMADRALSDSRPKRPDAGSLQEIAGALFLADFLISRCGEKRDDEFDLGRG
jgi:hypothetical protein